MHRAALSNESRAEVFQNRIHRDQDAEESLDRDPIVGFVHLILLEWDRIRNLVRGGMDFDVDAERVQGAHQFAIKVRNRARRKLQRSSKRPHWSR